MSIGIHERQNVSSVSDPSDYTVKDLLILWNESKDSAKYRDILRRMAYRADMGLACYVESYFLNGGGEAKKEKTSSKKDDARDHIKNYKNGSITDGEMAEFILKLKWDGSDPSGAMKISPDRAIGTVEGLSISSRLFTDKNGKHQNLVNMILDAFYRWYRQL